MALWRSILGNEKSASSEPAPQMQRRERRETLEKLVQKTIAAEGAGLQLSKPRLLALDREGKEFLVLLEVVRHPHNDQKQASGLQKIQQVLTAHKQSAPDLGLRSVYWTYSLVPPVVAQATPRASRAIPSVAAAEEVPTELAPLDEYEMASNFPLLGSDFDRPSRPTSLL